MTYTVYIKYYGLQQGFPKFFARGSLLAWKITSVLHILAHINTDCLDDMYPKLKIFISVLILDIYEYIPAAYITAQCMI
jgi:hypothetical protein